VHTLALDQCDAAAIERLLDDAFGTDRMARTAYKLRATTGWIKGLSFGMVDANTLVGSVQCWPVMLSQTSFPMVLVGPVAVAPSHQNSGIGRALMTAMLDAATLHGEPVMMMIGDPEYYMRYEFVAGAGKNWTLPGPWEPHRLLVRNPTGHTLPNTGTLTRDLSYAI
jgi:predicted N-acetyltransferase YhbS